MVRRARAGDVARVVEIERSSANVARWGWAAYDKYEREPREGIFHRCLLVAQHGERVVGFSAGSFLEGDEAALLENLAVEEGWRRHGVGRALCEAFAEWARSEGATGMALEVRVSNEAARSLYRALGFVEQGRRPKYYRAPEEDGVLMGITWV